MKFSQIPWLLEQVANMNRRLGHHARDSVILPRWVKPYPWRTVTCLWKIAKTAAPGYQRDVGTCWDIGEDADEVEAV